MGLLGRRRRGHAMGLAWSFALRIRGSTSR